MENKIKILGSVLTLESDDPNYLDALEKWGKDWDIQPVFGTHVVLSQLKPNQGVIYGTDYYHFRLTKK